MITCQHCNTRNHDGAVFCDVCGRELASARGRTLPTAPPRTSAAHEAIAQAAAPGANPHAAFPNTPQPASPQPLPIVIRLRLPNGQQFTLYGKDDYTIGRDDNGRGALDVDLAQWHGFDEGVSRAHLKIHARTDGVFVEDLESRNETVQNGYRLAPQQWYPLHDGDVLILGGITLQVSFERP